MTKTEITKIVNRWEESRLLEGLTTKKQKTECALLLDSITCYLLGTLRTPSKITKKEQYYVDSLIPITRRLYSEGIKNIEPELLYNNYVKFLNNKPKLSNKIKDKEAELVAIFCDNMIEEFNNI
jgi:hypothetical protein